ncbi:unnamed protein product [Arctia plantaginis]|uniref:Uncharacterized protein n=1 Tax=Arctia plantaginis TaxID=874455 RepID=A0A8S0Z8W3_ARCPL|nr:unnamed protein product [Arctia plantaginis]
MFPEMTILMAHTTTLSKLSCGWGVELEEKVVMTAGLLCRVCGALPPAQGLRETLRLVCAYSMLPVGLVSGYVKPLDTALGLGGVMVSLADAAEELRMESGAHRLDHPGRKGKEGRAPAGPPRIVLWFVCMLLALCLVEAVAGSTRQAFCRRLSTMACSMWSSPQIPMKS